MYKIISTASFTSRFAMCYFTIEKLPIFANEGLDWLLGQIVSIYTIFWAISYVITGIMINKFDIDGSGARSFVYFLVYLPIVGAYWVVLLIITHAFGVLPIEFGE